MKIFVTGGAGFVGSHLVDVLVDNHEVVVLDNLEYQVHGGKVPSHLNPEAKYVFADIRDKEILKKIIQDAEVIFHEAAAVGVGQSMYQIEKYVDVNTLGTAKLLEILVNEEHDVKKLIVASSMSIYGEGKYECEECGVVYPKLRPKEQLKVKDWEIKCPKCGKNLRALPTDEDKPLNSTSIYAITKKDQEEMCLTVGRAYGIPTVALRFFNIYGPRQALSNPYTGVCAIFSCRIRNGKPPVIFEDGKQSRDFIHVKDIVRANLLALNKNNANYEAFNVGTGIPISVYDVAKILIRLYKENLSPQIPGKYREGDIRHCFADISKIEGLGFKPAIKFGEGIADLVKWVNLQPVSEIVDRFEKAQEELEERKLTQ